MFIEFVKQGHNVTVMTQGDAEYVERFIKQGVKVIDCYPSKKICIKTIKKVHNTLKENTIDICYAFNSKTIPNAAFACIGTKEKLVAYRGTTGGLYRHDPSAYLTQQPQRVGGIGYQNRQRFKQELVDNNKIEPVVLKFSRLHNSFIEELSIKGIIGFLTLIFFLAPAFFVLRRGNIKNNVFSQLGVVHITLVMGYGLTQNHINHHFGMLQYLMFVIIFYSLLYDKNQKPTPHKIKVTL